MTCTLEFADYIFANPEPPCACVLENHCGRGRRIIQENYFCESHHISRNLRNLLSTKKTGSMVYIEMESLLANAQKIPSRVE